MSGKKLVGIVLGLILVLGGGVFGVYTWKMNAVSYQAIPIPVQGVAKEQRDRWTDELTQICEQDDVLLAVVRACDYPTLMNVGSEAEAVEKLRGQVKVRFRPRHERIEVGLSGKRKDLEALKKIAQALYGVSGGTLMKRDISFEEHVLKSRQ